MTQDEEHLRLLSVFHYVSAGLTALFACFPVIYVIFGLLIIFSPETLDVKGQVPPPFFGWMIVVFGSVFILVGWAIAGLIFATARFLAQRKHHLFCLVVAGIECMFVPIGTVLGVFTIVVLMRDSVKPLFEANAAASPETPGGVNF